MERHAEAIAKSPAPDRWTLIRDVAVLQVKLIVDGLRDFLLVPVSLIAGVISLLKGDAHGGTEFYDLLRMGRRSERWINLFGAADRYKETTYEDTPLPLEDIDNLVGRLETYVVDEYKKGGVTKQVKERLDTLLDTLKRTEHRKRQ